MWYNGFREVEEEQVVGPEPDRQPEPEPEGDQNGSSDDLCYLSLELLALELQRRRELAAELDELRSRGLVRAAHLGVLLARAAAEKAAHKAKEEAAHKAKENQKRKEQKALKRKEQKAQKAQEKWPGIEWPALLAAHGLPLDDAEHPADYAQRLPERVLWRIAALLGVHPAWRCSACTRAALLGVHPAWRRALVAGRPVVDHGLVALVGVRLSWDKSLFLVEDGPPPFAVVPRGEWLAPGAEQEPGDCGLEALVGGLYLALPPQHVLREVLLLPPEAALFTTSTLATSVRVLREQVLEPDWLLGSIEGWMGEREFRLAAWRLGVPITLVIFERGWTNGWVVTQLLPQAAAPRVVLRLSEQHWELCR